MLAPPPVPKLGAQWAWPLAVVSVGLGVLLLIWGDKYHRAALAMVGAGAGVLLASMMAPHLEAIRPAGQIAIPIVLAILAVLGAQYVWAVAAAGLALAGSGCVLVCYFAQGQTCQTTTAPAAGLANWAQATWTRAVSGMTEAWQSNGLVVALALFAAGAVPLIVGLLKPRLVTVAMTALVGATGAIFGVLLASAQITTSWWSAGMAHYSILAAAVGALTMLGMICQYRRILVAGRKHDEDQEHGQSDEPARQGAKKKASRPKKERGD